MLLARKVLNAAELLWDSLDEQERLIVMYGLAWVVVTSLAVLQRRSREHFKRELLDEMAAR